MSRRFESALLVTIALSVPSPIVAQQSTPDQIQAGYAQRVRDEPNSPELFLEIATVYWDMAYRFRATLSTVEQRELIARGLQSVDRAITLRPGYRQAFVYKNLLLRSEATVETDPARQEDLIRQADEAREKARALGP